VAFKILPLQEKDAPVSDFEHIGDHINFVEGCADIMSQTQGAFQLMHGDCLELMNSIPDESVDMILCDLPYGTTACKWDTVIPFEQLWKQYRRVAKRNAAIVLTASQPFTTALIGSNMREFRYCWVWDKVNKYTGALQAKYRPMRRHEDVCVFYRTQPQYNPQRRSGVPYTRTRPSGMGDHVGGACAGSEVARSDGSAAHPGSVIQIEGQDRSPKTHPTRKPVALMEYLIRTYTREGETVLDNCMGSGTTGVACVNTGRKFIGIEKDQMYYEIAKRRISENKRHVESK